MKSVTCVYLVMLMSVGFAQEDIDLNATIQRQTEPVEPTELICVACACADGVVDCAAREINSFFSIADWTGLKDVKPITVDLNGNSMPSITQISALPIQTLNLSSCQIENIQSFAFGNLEDLTVLDLSNNKIASSVLSRRVFARIPTGTPGPGIRLGSFEDMRTLSLAFNSIHSLTQDLFASMPSLSSLDLSGNPLAYIDQVTQSVITSLLYLKELKLANCELDNLPIGLFRNQRTLERLDLSDNRFTNIPAVLTEPVNLVYLNMNKNLMETITETTSISSLTKLQELHLCRMSKLTSISEGALGGLKSLVSLHICHNPRLTTIDPHFLMWTDDHDSDKYPLLQTLHLQSNNISVVKSDFLDRWDQLTDVDFTNNPYNCDCSAQWMVDILAPVVAASTGNDTLNKMFCNKPQDIRGISFATLSATSKTLVCPENEKMYDVPAPHTAIILGIMIGIFTTFPIVLIIVLLWRRGFFAKCRRKVIKQYDNSDDEDDAF